MAARIILAALLLASAPILAASAGPPAASPTPVLSAEDRDALGRVAYAEAGNQREEGLAAVVHVVLNRTVSGRFGAGVQSVLDAPGQFEPVARAGGTWRGLPPLTDSQRLVFGTILDLILQGRLPDPTGGSTHFQNAAIVAQRAAEGLVSPDLVNFGGQVPAAVIRDHSFFHGGGSSGAAPNTRRTAAPAAASTPPPAAPPAKFIRIGVAARAAGTRVRIVRGVPPSAL
jgi:Cell Wall Hydrolase